VRTVYTLCLYNNSLTKGAFSAYKMKDI